MRQRSRPASSSHAEPHEDEPDDQRRHADRVSVSRVRRRRGPGPSGDLQRVAHQPSATARRGPQHEHREHEQAQRRRRAPRRVAADRSLSSSRPQPASSARHSIRTNTTRRWLPALMIGMCDASSGTGRTPSTTASRNAQNAASRPAGGGPHDQRGRAPAPAEGAGVERALLGEGLHRGVRRAAPVVVQREPEQVLLAAARSRRSPRRTSTSLEREQQLEERHQRHRGQRGPAGQPRGEAERSAARSPGRRPRAAARPPGTRRTRPSRRAGGSSTPGGRRRTAAPPPPPARRPAARADRG